MIESATRYCSTCSEYKPLTAFGRRPECRECWATYMRIYRRGRRSKRIRDFVTTLSEHRNSGRLQSLVLEMIRHFGGVDKLAAAWFAEFDAARQSAPGSAATLRHLKAITALVKCAQE